MSAGCTSPVTLRFNFRGTERSEGRFDNGSGEVDDARAAIKWLDERHPDMPLWLSGFSFGAAIAVRVATTMNVDGLVSIAPAVRRFAGCLESQPQCPWLVVQGDEDELVDIDDTLDWLNSLEPGPELIVMGGAEHFFHGRLVELRETISDFIATNKNMSA